MQLYKTFAHEVYGKWHKQIKEEFLPIVTLAFLNIFPYQSYQVLFAIGSYRHLQCLEFTKMTSGYMNQDLIHST